MKTVLASRDVAIPKGGKLINYFIPKHKPEGTSQNSNVT